MSLVKFKAHGKTVTFRAKTPSPQGRHKVSFVTREDGKRKRVTFVAKR